MNPVLRQTELSAVWIIFSFISDHSTSRLSYYCLAVQRWFQSVKRYPNLVIEDNLIIRHNWPLMGTRHEFKEIRSNCICWSLRKWRFCEELSLFVFQFWIFSKFVMWYHTWIEIQRFLQAKFSVLHPALTFCFIFTF